MPGNLPSGVLPPGELPPGELPPGAPSAPDQRDQRDQPGHPDHAPPRRGAGLRRRLAWGCLPVLAVLVVVVLIVVVVVKRNGDNQSIAVPSGGAPAPTGPVVTLPGSDATATVFSIVQQPWGPRAIGWVSPGGLQPGEKVPLVILLHGLGASPQFVLGTGSWADAVSRHRIIVETPSGVQNSWNAGGCCIPARALGVDDVSFIDAVIDDALKRPNVDPARIYLVGQSNGGMMAYRYACSKAGRLAGVASVTGTNVSGCQPNVPIAVFDAHGTADDTVPYNGGTSLAGLLLAGGTTFPAVPRAAAATAEAFGCGATPASEGTTVMTQTWTGCQRGVSVRLVTVTGGRHDWLSGNGFDTTGELLGFFGLAS